MAPPKRPRRSTGSHRSTFSLQKTEIIINVYDLLPPGRVSSVLWALGTSLLHSGVVINGKEYAYGGHDRAGMTGVYWSTPKTEPPGGTFRSEIVHGLSFATPEEIDAEIRSASEEFLGPSYNLLTKNCNHFTAYICEKLTGRPGPAWLNRAAGIGVALPCVVPRSWIEPPDYTDADGGLLDDDDEYADEDSRMMASHGPQIHLVGVDMDALYRDEEDERRRSGEVRRKAKTPLRDSDGRVLPAAETAPSLLH